MSGSINDNSPATCEDSITVKLKSATDSKEHEIIIPSYTTATVQDLKALAQAKLLVPENKNIRLIYLGKLLDPGHVLISTFNIKNGGFIHAAISDKKPIIPIPTETIAGPETNTIPARSTLRGLDILVSNERDELYPNPLFRAGFSLTMDEVAALRTSFRFAIDEFIEDNSDLTARYENEDTISYRLRMESLYLEHMTENDEFYVNLPSIASRRQASRLQRLYGINIGTDDDITQSHTEARGSYHDYIWGFFMGFFLGFITVFCIWDRNVTYRQKVGIVCGVAFQMVLNSASPPQQSLRRGDRHQATVNQTPSVPVVATSLSPTTVPTLVPTILST